MGIEDPVGTQNVMNELEMRQIDAVFLVQTFFIASSLEEVLTMNTFVFASVLWLLRGIAQHNILENRCSKRGGRIR
jgi:hypothetical protein